MNKKMAAVAATMVAAVMTASAEVASQNVVGFENSESRSGYNYVIPPFRTVGGGEIDLQIIMLRPDLEDYSASLSFLTAARRSAHDYYWFSADSAADFETPDRKPWPTGQGAWVDSETYEPPSPPVSVKVGDSVQIDMGDLEEEMFSFAGQVGDEDLQYTARAGYNYIGNPYPTNLSLQNIQLDPTLEDYAVSLQFLTSARRSARDYYWFCPDSACDFETADGEKWPEGKGAWVWSESYEPDFELGYLNPGEAVQLDYGDIDESVLNVYAPFEL